MSNWADPPRIALALQGGGAHGAYGWGAIERLIDEDVEIVAISGASAGALNGAAVAAGLATGGRYGARAGLERLWSSVARESPLSLFDASWIPDGLLEPFVRSSLALGKTLSSYFAPFLPGVRDMTALRRIVGATIDVDALRDAIPFHVSATRTADGSARLFANGDVTLDVLMASACLPDLFTAVTIDGEDYWDGGFSANPALEPLLFADAATDMLVIQITPFAVDDVGSSVASVMARVSDIGFNACLMQDLDKLIELQDALRDRSVRGGPLQKLGSINLHLAAAPSSLANRGPGSKSDTRWSKLSELRGIGYEAMDKWLAANGSSLGRRSSLTTPVGVSR